MKVAVVTGANRGLGLATGIELASQGMHVVMCTRKLSYLGDQIGSVKDENIKQKLDPFELDITNSDQVQNLYSYLDSHFQKLDILVNNAGILNEATLLQPEKGKVFNSDIDKVRQCFEVNTLGTLRMMQVMLPLLRKSPAARVVNVSSGMGQLSDMDEGYPGYRMSKASVNVLTRAGAKELANTNIKINSVCPGWVKTDMGGENASRSLAEGIKGIVWAATLPEDGPTGGFYRDGVALDW